MARRERKCPARFTDHEGETVPNQKPQTKKHVTLSLELDENLQEMLMAAEKGKAWVDAQVVEPAEPSNAQ
ncbi:hypothetical protein NDU88_006429 [Pleurodeles waltl]|uniref:Uncharacterized protein n=1 Tax=Pleurodeles waltl TaxID=8319 RepID=A0AAV7N2C0_PLEWA|nr:hypothetical protein NDU88_006429 [Pleurodeles waltl]